MTGLEPPREGIASREGIAPSRAKPPRTRETLTLDKISRDAVEEARMVLPGIQTLFGFQLIAAFNERFSRLDPALQLLHYGALLLVAVAIALIMAPAAYHRLAERHSVSETFVRLASGFISAAMVPFMLAIAIEVYLLGRVILGDGAFSAAVAVCMLVIFSALWFALPLGLRAARRAETVDGGRG